MKYKSASWILFFIFFSWSTMAQKKNVNDNPYPYGNPVITYMYTADAAPKVMPDGKVWMVTSVDHEDGGGYATMHSLHVFSTSDMVNWKDEGIAIKLEDLGEPEGEDWAIWAPDIIYRNGTYYLYFPMRNVLADGTIDRYVVVAESDRMDKPFKVTNPRMEGVERAGLDPSVFIDDDGTAYLYWNQAFMGVLKEDMREIDGKMFKLDIGADNFMEAAWMHKRNGKYYYNYHTKYNGKVDVENPDDPERMKSHLDYSIGDSPRGPLTHMGPINYELGVGVEGGPKLPDYDYVPWRLTQSNHGAIVEFHGQEYFFYHTSALSSWRQDEFKGPGTWTQRSVCVDSLNYNADGTAIPVKQTVTGVGKVTIDQPYSIQPIAKNIKALKNAAVKKSIISAKDKAVVNLGNFDFGSGYYYFKVKVDETVQRGSIRIHLDSPDGLLMGTVQLRPNSKTINNGYSDSFIRMASGVHDIYLTFEIDEGEAAKVSSPEFFAGCPIDNL